MLKYKIGDLIEAAKSGEVNVIAQCCNCFNTRKSGIAPLIDKAFPETAIADDSTLKGDKHKLGKFTVAYSPYYDLHVYNLYGQYGFRGRYKGQIDVDYVAIRDAMQRMADEVSFQHDQPRIGLPLLGAGLAGGDWKIISEIIEETLATNFDVTIYVLSEETYSKVVN